MKRLNIAMLSEQTQEEVQQQTELEVVGEQAEDDIAEATQIQSDIENAQQVADEAEDVVQQVAEERQILEQAQQQGGADKPAMEALQRAVSRFEKRTGVTCAIAGMGMEAFSSKTSRAHATSVAMEGAMDFIKKIIKMLTNAMAAIWEKVKSFFEKIFNGATKLAKRAEQVKAAAKEAQGKTAPGDSVIKIGSVVKFARKDNKAVEGKSFADEYIKETSENYAGRASIENTIDSFLNKKETADVLLQENKAKIVEYIVAAQGPIEEGKAADGLHTGKGPKMLGDYVTESVTIAKDATWEQLSANYNKIKKTVVFDTEAKADAVSEVKPMSPEDAKRVAEHAAGHMYSYKNFNEQNKKFEAQLKKIVDSAKKLEKEKEPLAEQIRVTAGAVRAISNSAMGLIVSARSYDINLTKAALDYAIASVKVATGKGSTKTGTELAVV